MIALADVRINKNTVLGSDVISGIHIAINTLDINFQIYGNGERICQHGEGHDYK